MGLKGIGQEKSSRRANRAADQMASLLAALLQSDQSGSCLSPEESIAAYNEALFLYSKMSKENFTQVLRRLYREGEKEARERLRNVPHSRC